MSANDTQIGGDHYKTKPIQPWDFIIRNGIPWAEGSIVQYVVRWREKNGVEDLRKARHLLDKLIEEAEAEKPPVVIGTAMPSVPATVIAAAEMCARWDHTCPMERCPGVALCGQYVPKDGSKP